MIHNGHWTHPELWFMWISGLLSPVNTLAIIWLLVRRTGK